MFSQLVESPPHVVGWGPSGLAPFSKVQVEDGDRKEFADRTALADFGITM
jgi:hypothetical protein